MAAPNRESRGSTPSGIKIHALAIGGIGNLRLISLAEAIERGLKAGAVAQTFAK